MLPTQLNWKNCSESPLHKLQQDVPTRWNSIFVMLESLLNQLIHCNGGNQVNIDILNWHCLPRLCHSHQPPQFHVKDYLVLLVTLLTRQVHHLNKVLLTCSCHCVVDYLMTFEQEKTRAVSCFKWILINHKFVNYRSFCVLIEIN